MVAASRLRRAQERIQQARPFASEMLRVLQQPGGARRSVGASAARRARRAARRRQGAADRDHRRPRPVRQLQHQRDQGGEHVHRREPGARRWRSAWSAAAAATTSRGAASRSATSRSTCSRRCSSRHAQGDRRRGDRGVHRRRGRQRLSRLQRVPVGDVAAGRRRAAAADSAAATRAGDAQRRRRRRRRRPIDYLYEPAPEELFTRLLPRHVEVQVFRALLESNAAFYAAQMTAMDAATRNSARHDRAADALHEQGAPGGDHARDHRSGVGRGSVVGRVFRPGIVRRT